MNEENILNTLKRIRNGELGARIDENLVNPELRPLAEMINGTLGQFEEKMNEFVSFQEEAGKARARMNAMIRDNPLAIAILDRNRRRLDINRAYEEVWRGTRDELLRKNISDFDVRILSGDGFFATFEERRRIFNEFAITFPDGVGKVVQLHGIPIFDETGEVETAFYVYVDVTEQRRKMEEIRRLQQQSDAIIHNNPIPMLLTDTALNVLETNEAFVDLSGYSREQILSMNIRNFDIRSMQGEGVDGVLKRKQRTFCEVTVRMPSGFFTLQEWAIPLLDEKGDVRQILAVFVDITGQRKKEAEVQALMRDTEEVLDALETVPVMKIDRDFTVQMMNKAGAALVNKKPADVVGMKCYDIFNTTHCRTAECRCARAMQSRQMEGGETVARPLGREIPIMYDGTPLFDEAGNVVGAVEYVIDLTAIREKERQVQALMDEAEEKAETLELSVRELAAGLAAVAKGDLTCAVAIGEADPLAKVKTDFNGAMGAIAAAVREINHAIVQVEEGTAETSKGSEEIAKAAEQVSNTSQRCADLAKQVLDRIEEVDRQIADLSASNEEIASTSQDVLERAQNAAEQGAKAEKLGDEANTKMKIVEGIARQSVEEIEGLNAQMREINNIVKLITDIANQVNLLALNAAIEAARAGEHGRGFAVVAGEVRNLAGEAKSATQHIEKVIDSIRTSSEKTAAAIKSAHTEIGAGVESVNNTIAALSTIIAETESVAHGIGEIARATEDQANSTNNVVQGMAEGTRLTKETQNQMDDLAALAEEASASTEEIGSAAHEISRMAGDLRAKMQRFRV